jgi:hypothetical protein
MEGKNKQFTQMWEVDVENVRYKAYVKIWMSHWTKKIAILVTI